MESAKQIYTGSILRLADRLTEQPCNLLCDSGNNSAVEDSGQGGQQQCTQNYGDDDLHGIGDVEVAALVGDYLVGLADCIVESVADYVVESLHGIPPEISIFCFWFFAWQPCLPGCQMPFAARAGYLFPSVALAAGRSSHIYVIESLC